MFAVVRSVGAKPLVCTKKKFWEVVRSPQVDELCRAVEQGDEKAKRRLPAFCFHATFGGKARREANAVPSGLVMLDVDHVADVRALWEQIAPRVGGAVLLAHITPSGHGLRLVFPREGRSIADAQRHWAQQCGLEGYDAVTKDLARLSFAVPERNLLYVSDQLFADYSPAVPTPDSPSPAPAQAQPAAAPAPQEAPATPALPAPVAYRGIPLPLLVRELMVRLGGEPVEGERNARLYAAARYLRYVTDFDPARTAALLPSCGLPADEVARLCESACHSPRATHMPALLEHLVADLQEGTGEPADEAAAEAPAAAVKLPPLPELFRIFADTCPPEYKAAMVLSLLPVCGTLATRIRGEYIDRREHTPSFMTCLIAPQASGKSFVRTPVRLLLEDIAQKDAVERAKEQQYMLAMRAAKNAKKQPDDPRALIRIVPVSISISKLLKRLDLCEGQHLFSFSEELDTLTKSNSAGAWSAKTDIYRLAFDNAEYGQDYMSDNSYSAIVRVYYNLLLCGTPGAMHRFFRNAEDGLVSRFIFYRLPDMFGATLPQFQPLGRKQQERVRALAHQLQNASGLLKTPLLRRELARWQEEKRLQALETQSAALDVFRRRAGVIGFRAGMLANALAGKESAADAKFALWVAEQVLAEQIALFGSELEKQSDEAESAHTVPNLYRELPRVFTRGELIALRLQKGQSANVNALITRWQKNKMVERIEKNTYQKL